jgi:hypothetical protein
MIADCGLSFSVVDHKGFKNMMTNHLSAMTFQHFLPKAVERIVRSVHRYTVQSRLLNWE